MIEREEIVGYRVDGVFVCARCAKNFGGFERSPVFASDLDPGQELWCRACRTFSWPKPCAFCEIVQGRSEAEWILAPDYWPETVAFLSNRPISENHTLIVPKEHVVDFAENPAISAQTMRRAAELMQFSRRSMNLISTMGREAGQEIMHLHLHLIPREANDGIRLLTRKSK